MRHDFNVDPDRRSQWTAEVWPVIERVCRELGCDPRVCLLEAGVASAWGKHGVAHNWWNVPGRGDAGFVQWVHLVPTNRVRGGGVAPVVRREAKYKTLAAAVRAWCSRRRQR